MSINHINGAILSIILVVFLVADCNKTSPPDNSTLDGKIIELDKYETLISYEEQKLSNPQIIRYNDSNSHLFIYDASEKSVLEFDSSGKIVKTYGRQGRGPGEFLKVNNIFLANNYLYVIDRTQFRISRFTLDGNFDGARSFGKGDPQALPPAAPLPLEPRVKNINNQPAVTREGYILLSNIYPGDSFNTLYSLVDWEGDQISAMGDIPDGSVYSLDFNDYRSSIENREIPCYYRPYTFPIDDKANDDEIFLVYSAFPKIVKYTTSGEKLWEVDITEPAELDSLTTNFYEYSEDRLRKGPGRIGFDKYVTGISGSNGHLYLAMGKIYFSDPYNRFWIHEFDSNGKLIRRYKVKSENINIPSIFDIDLEGRRIFVPTEEAEIRAYPF